MKGIGPFYSDWAYYASPSSNLSAFAAPFSVNRSNSNEVSAPFMDLAESPDASVVPQIQFPVQSRSYGYDFFSNPVRELDSTPTSKPYGCSGLQIVDPPSTQYPHFNSPAPKDSFSYDQDSNGTNPSLVESQPYYASYISPPVHDPTPSVAPNHWSGFASLNVPSLVDFANKSPEEEVDGERPWLLSSFAGLNYGKSKQVGPGSSFSTMQTNVAGSDLQGASVMGSSSVSPETHHKDYLKSVADSANSHLSYTGSYDKPSWQPDKPSPVDIVPSSPMTGLVMGLNTGNIVADGDLGNTNFNNIKEAYHGPSPGPAAYLDLGQFLTDLESNERSSNCAMISDNNFSRDVVDYIFKERRGLQNQYAGLDNLSLRLGANGDVNTLEKSYDGVDQCTPSVDSPCWKGAPAPHFTQCEASEGRPPVHMHKIGKCFDSVIQEPQNFLVNTDNNVKISYQNLNSYPFHNGTVYHESSSPRKFSVAKSASEDCNSVAAVNTGPIQSEPTIDSGLKYFDNITEMKENCVPPTKPVHEFESESSHTEHQVKEESKLIFQKQYTFCKEGADSGHNMNIGLDYGSSSLMAEHALSSPSSGVDAPTSFGNSAGKASNQKLNVPMLVDTMHNLSELLLFQCSNGDCELKENDRNVLRTVISNLNACASKNGKQITSLQACCFTQHQTSRCSGDLCELQQDASLKRPQLSPVGSKSSKVELENLHDQEAKNLHFGSGKSLAMFSNSISPRVDAEMEREDNMTKAIKRILGENFHDDEGAESETALYKNLWLEAEAALCSINYKSRYNQMKIEMEKNKRKDVEEQSKSEIIPSSSKSRSFANEVHADPNPNSSAHDSLFLNAASLKDLCSLKFPVNMNKSNALNQDLDVDTYIQSPTTASAIKEVEYDEAILNNRLTVLQACIDNIDNSCMNTIDMREQDEVYISQDSPIPGKNKAADYDASVMARFHILKSRGEGSGSVTSEESKLSDVVEFAGKGIGDSTTNASEVKSLNVHENPSMMSDKSVGEEFNDASSVMARFHILKSRGEGSSSSPSEEGQLLDGDEFAGKGIGDSTKNASEEFHVDSEDNEEMQPGGFGSDWEHVEKKNL